MLMDVSLASTTWQAHDHDGAPRGHGSAGCMMAAEAAEKWRMLLGLQLFVADMARNRLAPPPCTPRARTARNCRPPFSCFALLLSPRSPRFAAHPSQVRMRMRMRARQGKARQVSDTRPRAPLTRQALRQTPRARPVKTKKFPLPPQLQA